MGRFSEKQLILGVIGGTTVLVAGFGALIWLDYQAIYKNEITDQNPGASEETNPEEWGERRKIQEIRKEMEAAQAEADLVAKREQDVIVYREIVHRDAKILPEVDDVNNLAKTINDFEQAAGVRLRRIGDLSVNVGGEAIKTMPIKLQLEGTFDQFLKFLNLFESQDRIINTRGFSITQGRAQGAGRDKVAVHDIQLDLVTYIYTPSAGLAKPVEIQNYDRRKDDPVIQKLVRQQKAARVDKYQLKPRLNRRDPLLDPRRPGNTDAVTADPADVQKQRDLVEKIKFDLELLKEDVKQEQIFYQEHRYVAASAIKAIIDEKCTKLDAAIVAAEPAVTVGEIKEAFHEEVVVPFEQIKGQRKMAVGPTQITRVETTKFLESMKGSMEKHEYENVAKLLTQFESLIKGQPVADDATDVIDEMRALGREAKVMVEFLSLKVTVSGLILRPEGGSMAIVNGKTRRVGDFVDDKNRCRLKEIHENHLLFELDGFEIEHAMDKK